MGSATRHESASSSRRSASQEASDKHKKDGAEEALKRLQEHVHQMAAKKKTEGRLPEPSVAVMSLLGELGSVPNALSLSRVFLGPVVAYWVVEDMWGPAVVGLAVAGASDWLDGYVAKRQGQQSVLGSYLDPFADKVLIGCVVAALVYKGSLPAWVAGTVIARDFFLVAGTIAHHSGRTKTPGLSWKELLEAGRGGQTESGNVRLVQPLFVSKVNTVVQLMLVASCMSQGLMGWPGDGEILTLSYATVCTTLLSWGAYARGYLMGSSRLP
ncbi:unnamed protein product [Ostreobium quekettii]|uniref:Uncharacterized protein n=1 Tax=Ostreobium quekettii TaxID=121088 RepID=A0A8S1JEU5_9CHLO|nr:unnamed protein product [Ostreobium quekettii]|eukprot:evm.model.scf_244.5 EVM.evm.TU.scf_244.5   scf_244:33977-35585(-)